VAKLLFEHCAARQAKAATPSAIPPLVFFSRPAAAQAEYAQALSEAGRWSEAFRAWENAERLYEEFGDQNIPIGATETIRLNDLESRVGQLGTTDPTVKLLRVGRHRIRYDYWLARCNLEQTRQFQLARKRWHEAAERARQSAPSEAHDLYRQSLQALSEARELYPAQMALAAGEFQRLAREYRNIAEQVSAVGDPPAILALIEESQPISRLPLMDLENDSGQSSRPRRGD
jgi:tetratricopeptide (TPR) repeat protein